MNEIRWEKVGWTANEMGTTITYHLAGTNMYVQSRRRFIPHANGMGFWEHTSYFVMKDGKEIAEKWRLADAKEYAERLLRKEET